MLLVYFFLQCYTLMEESRKFAASKSKFSVIGGEIKKGSAYDIPWKWKNERLDDSLPGVGGCLSIMQPNKREQHLM